jgi:hypothetical protein
MAHALIFGASGISGWSLMNQARIYPSPTAFACITGTTNRPTSIGQLQIPYDDRIQLASGIDLTKSVDEVVAALKEKVPHVDTVSHVFFTGEFLLTIFILTILSRSLNMAQRTFRKMISNRSGQ